MAALARRQLEDGYRSYKQTFVELVPIPEDYELMRLKRTEHAGQLPRARDCLSGPRLDDSRYGRQVEP